jgi:hypothetical protein
VAFGTLDRLVVMIVPVTGIVCFAAVLILRPLAKQLGQILAELKLQRGSTNSDIDVVRLAATVSDLQERIDALEKGADFDRALRSGSATHVER